MFFSDLKGPLEGERDSSCKWLNFMWTVLQKRLNWVRSWRKGCVLRQPILTRHISKIIKKIYFLSSSHPPHFSRNIVGLKQRCFSEHYSLSLTRWIFFLFLLFLIFFHRSSFLLLPLSSPENSINKPENSINKPKNFTSTQTHVNLSPFGLDLAMVARQMWQQQQGRCGSSSKVDPAAALTDFHWVFHVSLCWIFHMGVPLNLVFIYFGLDLKRVFQRV